MKMYRGRKKVDFLVWSSSFVSTTKDSSNSLLSLMAVLIVSVVGTVLVLVSTSNNDRYSRYQDLHFSQSNDVVHASKQFVTHTGKFKVNLDKKGCVSDECLIRSMNSSRDMTDEELFRSALSVLEKEGVPFKRVPKIAFMFLTRGPLPMVPLWERFFQGQDKEKYSIYVHALPGYELNVRETSVFHGRQIASQHVEWGLISLVDAERRLLANALLDLSNERFVLLSESCIPIYNFTTVYKYLTSSTHSFVQVYDEDSIHGRGRYSRLMRPDITLADWRKGSQWFELSRFLSLKIISETKYYTLFKKYCKPTCYPDEHYIQTYLHMFYGGLIANRTVTYVDWSVRASHPGSFSAANITEGFLQTIRNDSTLCSYDLEEMPICFLFARKFDASALEPLLNLSSKVMGF